MSERSLMVANARLDMAEKEQLRARIKELEAEVARLRDEYTSALGTLRAIGEAIGERGDENSILAAVRRLGVRQGEGTEG